MEEPGRRAGEAGSSLAFPLLIPGAKETPGGRRGGPRRLPPYARCPPCNPFSRRPAPTPAAPARTHVCRQIGWRWCRGRCSGVPVIPSSPAFFQRGARFPIKVCLRGWFEKKVQRAPGGREGGGGGREGGKDGEEEEDGDAAAPPPAPGAPCSSAPAPQSAPAPACRAGQPRSAAHRCGAPSPPGKERGRWAPAESGGEGGRASGAGKERGKSILYLPAAGAGRERRGSQRPPRALLRPPSRSRLWHRSSLLGWKHISSHAPCFASDNVGGQSTGSYFAERRKAVPTRTASAPGDVNWR